MSNQVTIELLTRVIKLEEAVLLLSTRVADLDTERILTVSEKNPSKGEEATAPRRAGTRNKAISAMRSHLDDHDIQYEITGPNRPMFIIRQDGTKHRFGLWSSKNDRPEEKSFYSWHRVKVDDVDSDAFDYFILSVEDENGYPLFFILTRQEMQAAMDGKIPSKGYYWVYITRASVGNDDFQEVRDGIVNYTPYYENWRAL